MAYHTIKTIHGKRYMYLQRTFREGGKVRTESKYVGLVDDDGVITESPSAVGLSKPEAINFSFPPSVSGSRSSENGSETVTLESVTLQKVLMKCDFSFFHMSEKGLLSEYKAILSKLEYSGISSRKVPEIILKFGKEVTHYKKAFSQKIVVTVPKKKGNREAFRREYRKALHRIFIETLEREKPEEISPFLSIFDSSFRATQKALFSYMANTNSKDKFVRALILKYWSVMRPIPMGKKEKLPPEKLGLVVYGIRKNWKDEFCELMAELDKKGFDAIFSKANLEITKANNAQRKVIKQKTIFFFRKRKTVKRLQARIDSNRELVHKLLLLRPLI